MSLSKAYIINLDDLTGLKVSYPDLDQSLPGPNCSNADILRLHFYIIHSGYSLTCVLS
ncbi:hypothetical protein J6590_091333 [Homalodisca vitripennis]|nr:hypothetical protein J6590_091333 [Homalodisca vitripennis]